MPLPCSVGAEGFGAVGVEVLDGGAFFQIAVDKDAYDVVHHAVGENFLDGEEGEGLRITCCAEGGAGVFCVEAGGYRK